MKTPATIADYTDLIKNMDHRERFVFKLANATCEKHALEIYASDRMDSKMGDDPRNIKFAIVDNCGKTQGKTVNRLRRLMMPGAGMWGDDGKLIEKTFGLISA
jgi:hypothetical protein